MSSHSHLTRKKCAKSDGRSSVRSMLELRTAAYAQPGQLYSSLKTATINVRLPTIFTQLLRNTCCSHQRALGNIVMPCCTLCSLE